MNPTKNPITSLFGGGGLIAVIAEAIHDPASLLKPQNLAVIAALLGLFFTPDANRTVQVEDVKKAALTTKAAEEKKP